MNLRILIISAHFPPSAEVGGRRAAKFAEHLPSFGCDPIVITLPTPKGLIDHPGIDSKILRVTPWPNPINGLAAIKGTLRRLLRTKQGVPRTLNPESKASTPLSQRVLVPDRYIFWYPAASRAAVAASRNNRVDAVLSSGPPWTCHLIARALHRKLGIPWLADFRDPWLPESRDRPRWRWRIERRLEAICLREADAIVCNTERIRYLLLNKVSNLGASRFLTISNGFEPLRQPFSLVSRDHHLLLHVGTIYGTRRIDTFCSALKMLLESGKVKNIRVVFVGEVEDHLLRPALSVAQSLFDAGIIKIMDQVSWQKADEYILSADLHLIFQGEFRDQIPAKFFECLRTGKPILAVARSGELSRVIFETSSGVVAPPDDPGKIADSLLKALSMPCRSIAQIENSFAGQYRWESLVEKLSTQLHEITAEKRRA